MGLRAWGRYLHAESGGLSPPLNPIFGQGACFPIGGLAPEPCLTFRLTMSLFVHEVDDGVELLLHQQRLGSQGFVDPYLHVHLRTVRLIQRQSKRLV